MVITNSLSLEDLNAADFVWIQEIFKDKRLIDFPIPYIYPSDLYEKEKGVMLEWDVNHYFISLNINPKTKRGNYYELNMDNDEDRMDEHSTLTI